jgi:DNA-binding transcriptional ArsR family regulator
LTTIPIAAILNHMVYQSAVLDATFAALADPTRREILARLAGGNRSISELASRFDMSLPAVSKHVRVLERAGLTTVERHGRVRHVRINPAPMRGALEWIEFYRRFWESELDLLAAYLESPESEWQTPLPQPEPASKFEKPSARPSSASTTRGRKKKS